MQLGKQISRQFDILSVGVFKAANAQALLIFLGADWL